MKITFVRHGQTNDNLNRIFSGQKDVPLNEKGINQAKITAEKLRNVNFDVCFCSPLLRAKQTMEEIVKFHKELNIVFDERLMERDYGDLVDQSEDEVPANKRWDMNYTVGRNVETIDDMTKRMNSFLNYIKTTNNENVLIVAHSGVGRIFRSLVEGFPENENLENLGISNAEVYTTNF